jgi:hypothetical protein
MQPPTIFSLSGFLFVKNILNLTTNKTSNIMKKLSIFLFCGLLCATNLNAQTWNIGYCGTSTSCTPTSAVTATLKNDTLTISGSGQMKVFGAAMMTQPWYGSGLTTLIIENGMSEADRRRLLGSGVRRYGFIDKTLDIATANEEFAPPFLDLGALHDLIRQIEALRNINASLQQVLRLNGDLLLLTSDVAYRLALIYYNSVRDASRRRVPGAQAIFRVLQLFFARRSRSSEEPTEAEIERDVKALLKGTKDGEIIIKNQRPTMVGGKRTIVDETRKERVAVKRVDDAEMS